MSQQKILYTTHYGILYVFQKQRNIYVHMQDIHIKQNTHKEQINVKDNTCKNCMKNNN